MSEHLGIDGLLEPEEIDAVPLILAAASAAFVATCAVGAWVAKRLLVGARKPRTGEYWRY